MAKRNKAAERPAVEYPPDDPAWDIKIELANMGEKDDFLTALHEGMETGVTADVYPWYAKFVRAWPFEGLNPNSVDDYRKLSFAQWRELDARIGKAMHSFREQGV